MARDYTRQEVLEIIQNEAQERGIPRDDFLRFAYIETGGRFDEQASRGPNGAKGLFQFVPDTAAEYGISGRELDAVVNTDAAARLYLNNRQAMVRHHDRTGDPYLSGQSNPNGLDMYLAHQQGFRGYQSIQDAISDGSFTHPRTRANILNNVSDRDIERITGMSKDEFGQLPDRQMAETFVRYWDTKYRNISIPEVGIQPLGGGQQTPGGQSPGGSTAAAALADGVLERGESGAAVRAMQEKLIRAGITQVNGRPFTADGDFGPQTEAAVREYQRSRGLEVDGKAGPQTLGALNNNTPARVAEAASDQPQPGAGTSARTGPQSFNDVMRIMLPPQNGVSPHITSDFGPRQLNGKNDDHGGVDFNYVGGQNGVNLRHPTVRSPVSGEVVFSGGQYGTVKIRDDQGNLHEILHLNSRSVQVTNPPTRVEAGDPIGTMGGRGPNGAGQYAQHVHYQMRDANNRLIDPEAYWNDPQRRQGQQAQGATTTEPMADGVLRKGERGAEVAELQRMLNQTRGADQQLKVDGNFGDQTRQAVIDYQRAAGMKPDGIAGPATLGSLRDAIKTDVTFLPGAVVTSPQSTDKPLITDPNHPDNRLYKQAYSNLEQLGPNGGFKSQDEMQKAAAALAADAKASGLTQIDHVTRSTNGQGLIAVQGQDPWADGAKRAYLDQSQATNQSVEQSTKMADAQQSQRQTNDDHVRQRIATVQ